ncbi:MAG: hypothetical protein ACK5KT_12895 [Dysgonomonas sp.]
MDNNSFIEQPIDVQKGYLALPIEKGQLVDFIKGLLGSSQTINKKIGGVFEIHMNDLQNFNDLILQRVTQNKSALIEFCATIYFSDNSHVKVFSFEELLTYNEIKPVVSNSIRMNWSFLIEFPDKETPEKQNIELYFCAKEKKTIPDGDRTKTITFSYFELEIQHTNRTWGTDIENTLNNQISSISKKTRSEKYDFFISLFTFLVVLILFFGAYYNSASKFIEENRKAKVEEFEAYVKSIDSDDLKVKIDNLINVIVHDGIPNYNKKVREVDRLLIYGIGGFIAITLAFICSSLVLEKKESHLVLTRKAKLLLDQYHKKKKRDWYMLALSIFLGILGSIVASYIFSIISQFS